MNVCTCIVTNHDHAVALCPNKATAMYGTCSECRYFAMGEPPGIEGERTRGWAHTCYCLNSGDDEAHRRYQ